MALFKRVIDFVTLGSKHPMRRLVAYYALLGTVVWLLYTFVPVLDHLLSAEGDFRLGPGSRLLQDGLTGAPAASFAPNSQNRIEHAIATLIVFISTLALMVPVTWVYMSARRERAHNQSVVQTLIVLPMIVAGVILIVRDSLALAFSLAGVVAAVRFRTSLSDPRDIVFIFLSIAVGFAAGTQVLSVAALLSVLFNVVLVLVWQYDFGRNVLEPTAGSEWTKLLGELVGTNGNGSDIPDRDLALALTPTNVDLLSDRFKRVGMLVGRKTGKPRYTSILSLTTSALTEAQASVEKVLEGRAKKWVLDQVVTNEGKPSELFYLVRLRKDDSKDALLTAIRQAGGSAVGVVDLEVGEAVALDKLAAKKDLKQSEKAMAQ